MIFYVNDLKKTVSGHMSEGPWGPNLKNYNNVVLLRVKRIHFCKFKMVRR